MAMLLAGRIEGDKSSWFPNAQKEKKPYGASLQYPDQDVCMGYNETKEG
jgi:hypothetical protein